MDTFSSQCKSIMCIKRLCNCFKPRIKYKGSVSNFLIDIYVRDIQNDTIKIFNNFGLQIVFYYVTQKVLIIDTTLRSFIQPHVCKLYHICGYELCIIPKDMQIDLNRSRTIITPDLQHKFVGRHKHSSLFRTESATH